MTDQIYCVSSVQSLGCTFVDWSLLYLSGQQHFFNVKESSFVAVIGDPLLLDNSTPNAHGHKKNHPSGKMQTIDYASKLKAKSNGIDLFSMYPFPLYEDHCCYDLGFDPADISQPDRLRSVRDYQKHDYLGMLRSMSVDQDIPVIYVWYDHRSFGYHWTARSLDRKMLSDEKPSSLQDCIDEYQEFFFQDSLLAWENLGLRDPWDIRERLALNIRPFDQHWGQNLVPETGVNFVINCLDLWSDTESIITDIMTGLGINIRRDRLASWRTITKTWQGIQQQHMEFPSNLTTILDSIINNRDYIMPKLSFYQEAIIQHCLIYQHGLNFKTWMLSKFPDNTRDLHILLEPNIHHIDA